jgi:hypothetical protein
MRRPPSDLQLREIDAALICDFLDSLETERSSSAHTRNLRLISIRSFFRFVAFEAPDYSGQIQRILAIPSKRHDKKLMHFLRRPEIDTLLGMWIVRLGSDDATMRCYCSPSIPDCDYRREPTSIAIPSSSVPVRTCAAPAKVAKTDARLFRSK